MGLFGTIVMVLLIFWLVGAVSNVVGPLIHLLLLIAAILFVVGMFTGRSRV